MKAKRLLGLLLATSMVLGMCSCGAEEAESKEVEASASSSVVSSEASGSSTPSTEEAGPTVEKPEKITWWSHSGLPEEEWVQEWDAAYEELTGVDLEHTQVSNNEYYSLLEVAFASGTEPNVFDLAADTKLAYYASQGGIADLTDLIKECGMYEKVSPEIWESVSVDGRIYGIPAEMPSGAVTYVREDWLEKLGMKAPANYEEFIDMLRRFKNEIPECKIPLTAPGFASAMNLPEFYQDATPDVTKVDGVWVDGMAQDNMVGAMQRLQDAYAEGLIDMETVTNTTGACRDKWYAGEVGVFNYWAGKWGNTLHVRLKENFPDAQLLGIDSIKETFYRYAGFNCYVISGKLSEEEIAQVFYYFMNVYFDGAEGQDLFYCGVEGLHRTTDANGYISYNATKSNPESSFQSVWATPWLAVIPFDEPEKAPQPDDMVTVTLEILENSNSAYKPTMPVSDAYNSIVSDLTAVRNETIANIVMGEVSVEEGLANYKKQADILGIAQVLEELNR